MVSVVDALVWIFAQLYISMYPVGDIGEGDLSLGFGGGSDISPSPMADVPPPPPTQMSASYLFTRIRTDKGMLINILAVVSAVLIGVQALLGSRRRRLGSKAFIRLLLWASYTVSFPVVSYTIGLVQSVGSRHGMPDSQLLWAVGLLLLLGSVNGMSAFSRHDIEQSKEMLAKHAFQTLLVLWLLYSRSDVSDGRWVLLDYFLLCWIYSIFKMAQRMKALRTASSAHGLVRSAMVVADYMKADIGKEHNPKNMTECKYLVVGEDKDSEPPSKLLKRRFCGDLDIAEAGDQKTMEFVVDGLLADDGEGYERAFRVVEVELSFLYDFFYTKYPALFPTNRLLGFIRFFVLLGFLKVLLVDFIFLSSPSGYEPPENTFIYFNNVLLIVMILSIDILQHLATGYSNWALVQFVCDYVVNTGDGKKQRCRKRGCGIRRALMKLVAAWRWRKSAHCWDNKLGQYSLLKSYDYNPSKTGKNALSWLSLRMMEPTDQGRRQEPDVPLTAEVRKAVLDCLKETRGLPSVGRSLKESARHLELHWACDDLPTHTHTVLVWHIATTMCDLDDSDEHGHRHVATTLSGYCAYLLAFVPDMLPDNSYKAKQILDAVVEEARTDLGDTKDMPTRCDTMFQLKAKKPSSSQVEDTPPTILFPGADNGYKAIPMQVLDGVVNDEAQTYIRGGGGDTIDTSKSCDMAKPSSSSQVQDEQRSPEPEEVKDTPILILAADLGRQLKKVDKPRMWELLARFWAELVLFLAPSNNANVHFEHLATGGEFITHLWALLTHAGIVERPLHASPI
ncbi:unnamed protein product [Miscanthus lutarioriparius]|uniref:DUF4220 domain-containing protein n=1 Tax=Miscanthus lutarioriparius TaxID=422564 RepID=A0A811Q6A9_9POAL|nr:unnamed protein product [Miscanthus lutarioriparius]